MASEQRKPVDKISITGISAQPVPKRAAKLAWTGDILAQFMRVLARIFPTFSTGEARSADFQSAVSRISNPPGLGELWTVCRLEVGDTAGWKPALLRQWHTAPHKACEISGLGTPQTRATGVRNGLPKSVTGRVSNALGQSIGSAVRCDTIGTKEETPAPICRERPRKDFQGARPKGRRLRLGWQV